MNSLSRFIALLSAVSVCAFSCDTTDNSSQLQEAVLEVTPASVEFNSHNTEGNTFTVESNVDWYTECSESSLKFRPEAGSAGETTVTVTGIGAEKTGIITVISRKRSPDDKIVQREVTVTYSDEDAEPDDDPDEEPDEEFEGEIIYSDDLDKNPNAGDSNTYLDKLERSDYVNATGTGASNVTYTGQGMSLANNFTSQGYTGASGNNAINFYHDNRTLTISNITLTPGQTKLEFSFGATPYGANQLVSGEEMTLYADFGNGTAHKLDFTAKKGSRAWYTVSAVFEITGGTPDVINFQITAKKSRSKVDDFKLATTDKQATQTIEYAEKENLPLPEIPETVKENSDYQYVTHFIELNGKTVRNYSACYDTRRHNPVWVAYPMHTCYSVGGWERTTPDPWRRDPEIDESAQSKIYGTDWREWPWGHEYSEDFVIGKDQYQFWATADNAVSYGRGHLLRSADRGGHNTPMNIQTFYPTNIAPEKFQHPNIHETLEYKLPNDWICADTTYVVAGCYYGGSTDDGYFVYDACSGGQSSPSSKICDLPIAQFKIYLRTKSGKTMKHISECSADELMAIGFWLPQILDAGTQQTDGNIEDFAYSVDDIEKMIGGEFEFFPGVPDEVTSKFKLSDWGL